MIRIRFKTQDKNSRIAKADLETNTAIGLTSTNYKKQSVVYSEVPEMRLLKREEIEKIVKEIRQRLLGLGFRARIKIKGSGLILNYLRLKEATHYTEPYQNSDYKIRNEFGVVWIDDLRNTDRKTKKAKKRTLLQYRDWQNFQSNVRELAFAHNLVGSIKKGNKRFCQF